MKTGNKGEWSEPYALLKLISDGKLFLGDEQFNKIEGIFYPIIKVLRHEKDRNVEFTYEGDLIIITDGILLFKVPIKEFIKNTIFCFEQIKKVKSKNGSFSIPEIEEFLNSFSIKELKAKSKLKNDITIQLEDPHTFLTPSLGFSIKSQMGRPSTLFNASGATNFIYRIIGNKLTTKDITSIDNLIEFSDKLDYIKKCGSSLEFEKVENETFEINLKTIDYYFDIVLSQVILLFYINNIPSENSIKKFIKTISLENPLKYNLKLNPKMYEMSMRKFLMDFALGMRPTDIWERDYEATGGYLIVKEDGEIICYHFYFTKNFENYLFNNTKLETPSVTKHKFGTVFIEKGEQKIKLNLQIRFIK